MRTILYATLIVGLAAPAYAQVNILGAGSLKRKTQDQVEQEDQRNKDYQEKLKQLPDQNVKADPWGNMRGASQSDQKAKKVDPKQKKAAGAN